MYYNMNIVTLESEILDGMGATATNKSLSRSDSSCFIELSFINARVNSICSFKDNNGTMSNEVEVEAEFIFWWCWWFVEIGAVEENNVDDVDDEEEGNIVVDAVDAVVASNDSRILP